MAVKQLHLNDVSKTPIEPVISTGSIPNGAVTEEKLEEKVKTIIKGKLDKVSESEFVTNTISNDSSGISAITNTKDNSSKYIIGVNNTFGVVLGDYSNNPDKLQIGIHKDVGITIGNSKQSLKVTSSSATYNDKKIATVDLISNKQDTLTAGSITSDLIADSAVTKAKIAPKTITANEIADGTISTAQLDNQVVSNINNAVNQSSSAQSMADTANTTATSAKALAEANKAKLDKINTDLLVVVSDVQSVQDEVKTKQANLVSGTNIKTVNGNSLLGAGDISISGGETSYPRIYNINLDKTNSDKLFSSSAQPKGTKVIINDSNLSDYDIIKINSNDGHSSSLLYLTTKTYFIIYENLMALYSDMITGFNKWSVMVFYAEGSKNIELEIM